MENILAHLNSAQQYVNTGLSEMVGSQNAPELSVGPNTDLPHYNPGGPIAQEQFVGPNTDIPHYNPNVMTEPQSLTADNSYTFVTRAFAPDSTFGGGFEGNDRGYSTDIDASSKVTQEVGIDLDEEQPITSFDEYSDETKHRLVPEGVHSPTESPDGSLVHSNVVQDGDTTTLQFGTELDAENPFIIFPGDNNPAPSIDIFTEYEIVQDKDNNVLNISGTITGDDFPATEALIYDSNGQPLFLGVGAPPELASPLVNLIGENNRPITDFEISVNTDDHGNFVSVEADGQEYTIEEWNESFTSQDIEFTDPLTDPFNEGLEEINEAGGEIADEVSEAGQEISDADGFLDTSGEILEGGAEIGLEVVEGTAETVVGFAEGTQDTVEGIIGSILN